MRSEATHSRYHLFNTNTRFRPVEGHEFMLRQGCAAAFFDFRHVVDELRKGDVVFLYESKAGIVAMGIADGEVRKEPATSIDGSQRDNEGKHWMKLDEFTPVEPPIPAKVIRGIVEDLSGGNIVFRLARIPLRADVGKAIHRLARGRNAVSPGVQRLEQGKK